MAEAPNNKKDAQKKKPKQATAEKKRNCSEMQPPGFHTVRLMDDFRMSGREHNKLKKKAMFAAS